jgi:hypothetical protein
MPKRSQRKMFGKQFEVLHKDQILKKNIGKHTLPEITIPIQGI